MPKVNAQIVHRPRARKAALREQIDALVRERVAEILSARDGEMLDQFASSKDLSTEITRRTNLFDRRKWALYFARWGCLDCGTKKRVHCGHGYCQTCHQRIALRLKALRRDWDAEHPQHPLELDAIDHKIRMAKQVYGSEE